MQNGAFRFWLPFVALLLLASYSGQKLVRAHVWPTAKSNVYEFERTLPARRGVIYDAKGCAMVKSIPVWNFHLDPVALTNAVLMHAGTKTRISSGEISNTIADALGMDRGKMAQMVGNARRRYQPLGMSSDDAVYKKLADSKRVAGVVIEDSQVRQYLMHRRLSHVLGAVNVDLVGLAGIELKYNRWLTGTPGTIRGILDGRHHEIYDKRIVAVAPVPGADVHLTIDHTLQYEAETALADGLRRFGASAGWTLVMDSRTGAIVAMASLPDYDPIRYGASDDTKRINRVTSYTYEPGSVMKVITVAAAIDSGFTTAGRMYSTDRNDSRYYHLPGDGSHRWDPYMSIADGIVRSSNIVIGKLGYDLGQKRLWEYMTAFGFGRKTNVELPGEEVGILHNWRRWDKASWSRVPIGQGVTVTAVQLVSAYQAIANDGVRMQPHIVSRVVDATGNEIYHHYDRELGRPISMQTARQMREIMMGVTSKERHGTARRAALTGFTVAGKTGTAQKVIGRHYANDLFWASFIGIVPATTPRYVILVTLDFSTRQKNHQGGDTSAVVFNRLAKAVLRYAMVPPDKPDEIDEYDGEDDLDRIMEERSLATAEAD